MNTDKKRAPHSLPTDAVKYGLTIKAWIAVVGFPAAVMVANRQGLDFYGWCANLVLGAAVFLICLVLARIASRDDIRAADLWIKLAVQATQGRVKDSYDGYNAIKINFID